MDQPEGQNDLLPVFIARDGKGLGADPAGPPGKTGLVFQVPPVQLAVMGMQLGRRELLQERGPVGVAVHMRLHLLQELLIGADILPRCNAGDGKLGDLTGIEGWIYQGDTEIGPSQGFKAAERQPPAAFGPIAPHKEIQNYQQESQLQNQLRVENVGGVLGNDGAGNGDDACPAVLADDVIDLIAVLYAIPANCTPSSIKAGHQIGIILIVKRIHLTADVHLTDLLVKQYVSGLVHHRGGAGKNIAALLPLHLDIAHPNVQGQHAFPVREQFR